MVSAPKEAPYALRQNTTVAPEPKKTASREKTIFFQNVDLTDAAEKPSDGFPRSQSFSELSPHKIPKDRRSLKRRSASISAEDADLIRSAAHDALKGNTGTEEKPSHPLLNFKDRFPSSRGSSTSSSPKSASSTSRSDKDSPKNIRVNANKESPKRSPLERLETVESSDDSSGGEKVDTTIPGGGIFDWARCEETLKQIHTALHEHSEVHRAVYKRNMRGWVLSINKSGQFKWVENRFLISSGSRLAVRTIIRTTNDALSHGHYTFRIDPKEGNAAVDLDPIQLMFILLESSLEAEILYGNRELRESWIKLLLIHKFQKTLDRISSIKQTLIESKQSIQTILEALTRFQEEEIEIFKKEHRGCFVNDVNVLDKTLVRVPWKDKEAITHQLGLSNALELVGPTRFLPILRDIIFENNPQVYGCRKNPDMINPLERFILFFVFWESEADAYQKFIEALMEEDPKKKFLILEYFLRSAKTPVELKIEDPEGVRHKPWSPCIAEKTRGLALELFNQHNYQAIPALVMEKLDRECTRIDDFVRMILQLEAKAIKLLKRKGANADIIDSLNSSLDEQVSTDTPWQNIQQTLKLLAENITKSACEPTLPPSKSTLNLPVTSSERHKALPSMPRSFGQTSVSKPKPLKSISERPRINIHQGVAWQSILKGTGIVCVYNPLFGRQMPFNAGNVPAEFKGFWTFKKLLDETDSDRTLKRRSKNHVLLLDSNHSLKWYEKNSKEVTSSARSEAAIYSLKLLQDLLTRTEQQVIPQGLPIEITDIVKELMENEAFSSTIFDSRELEHAWINFLLANMFKKPLSDIRKKLSILENAKPDIQKIILQLIRFQKAETEAICKEYFPPQNPIKDVLIYLPWEQILGIISRLDLNDLLAKTDKDNFLPILTKIIFKDPDELFAFNGHGMDNFQNFFASCVGKYEQYARLIGRIRQEDPHRKYRPLEYYIKTMETADDKSENEKRLASEFFEKRDFSSCAQILTDSVKRALIMPNEGLPTMMKQLCKRGINLLERHKYDPAVIAKLRDRLESATGDKVNWIRLLKVLHHIATALG